MAISIVMYVCTDYPNIFGGNDLTNAILTLLTFANIAGTVKCSRIGSVSSIATGIAFCAR